MHCRNDLMSYEGEFLLAQKVWKGLYCLSQGSYPDRVFMKNRQYNTEIRKLVRSLNCATHDSRPLEGQTHLRIQTQLSSHPHPQTGAHTTLHTKRYTLTLPSRNLPTQQSHFENRTQRQPSQPTSTFPLRPRRKLPLHRRPLHRATPQPLSTPTAILPTCTHTPRPFEDRWESEGRRRRPRAPRLGLRRTRNERATARAPTRPPTAHSQIVGTSSSTGRADVWDGPGTRGRSGSEVKRGFCGVRVLFCAWLEREVRRIGKDINRLFRGLFESAMV